MAHQELQCHFLVKYNTSDEALWLKDLSIYQSILNSWNDSVLNNAKPSLWTVTAFSFSFIHIMRKMLDVVTGTALLYQNLVFFFQKPKLGIIQVKRTGFIL